MSFDNLKQQIAGPIAYPPTPFRRSEDSSRIDPGVFRKQIRHLVDANVPAITPCGGTGEFFSLTMEEWQALTKIAVKEASGESSLIIASVGGKIGEATEMAREAERLGCGLIQITMLDPMFGITEEGLYRYISRIASSVEIGVMHYNTGNLPLSLALAKRLCEIPNTVAFKDEAGEVTWFREIFPTLEDEDIVGVCGGGESLFPYYYLAGAKAFTTGIVNLVPRVTLNFYQALVEENWQQAFRIQSTLQPLMRLRGKPGRMIPVTKEGLKIKGITDNSYVRPPVAPLSGSEKQELQAILDNLLEESQ